MRRAEFALAARGRMLQCAAAMMNGQLEIPRRRTIYRLSYVISELPAVQADRKAIAMGGKRS